MTQYVGTVQNGQVILDSQVDWPNGTRVSVARVTTGFAPTDQVATVDELEQLADELADDLDASLGPDREPLSDYAVSREGIYGDHP